jgi:hypothetical protein
MEMWGPKVSNESKSGFRDGKDAEAYGVGRPWG